MLGIVRGIDTAIVGRDRRNPGRGRITWARSIRKEMIYLVENCLTV